MNGPEDRRPAGCHHYKLDVRLSPTSGLVTVTAAVDLRLPPPARASGEIILALHRSARIGRLEGPPGTRFDLREGTPLLYSPESATLAIMAGREVSPVYSDTDVPVLRLRDRLRAPPGDHPAVGGQPRHARMG